MHLRTLGLILPFVVPFVFHWLYQPVNRSWTVKRFGCGCPPMMAPPGSWGFNANYFNFYIWVALLAACAISWWSASGRTVRGLTPNQGLLVRVLGLFALLHACATRFGKEFWL